MHAYNSYITVNRCIKMSFRRLELECSICHNFAAPYLKSIVRHIGSVHSFDPSFRILCGIHNCTRVYTNFSSFRSHLYRKHKKELQRGIRSNRRRETHFIDANPDVNVEDGPSSENDQNMFITQCEFDEEDFRRCLALFLLKAREVHKVSQKAINGLIVDVTMLFQQYTNKLRKDFINENNYSENLISIFNSLESADPFMGLHTEFLQQKYFKQKLGLVVS